MGLESPDIFVFNHGIWNGKQPPVDVASDHGFQADSSLFSSRLSIFT
jgi:hypothetical protein